VSTDSEGCDATLPSRTWILRALRCFYPSPQAGRG
jgi:hypothetical protein